MAISSDKTIVNQLNDSEDRIIKYLKKNESITNKQAREITELSPSGVRKVFEGLIQKRLCFKYVLKIDRIM